MKTFAFILALVMVLPLCLCACDRTGNGEATTPEETESTTEAPATIDNIASDTTVTTEAVTTAAPVTTLPETTLASETTMPETSAETEAETSAEAAVETTADEEQNNENDTTAPVSSLISQYNDYVGTWYNTKNAPDILTLSVIDDYTFRLEVSLYRITDVYATVKIENNEVIFRGTAGDIGENMPSVNGTLVFKDNTIIFTITESKFMYLAPGYYTNFYIKVE